MRKSTTWRASALVVWLAGSALAQAAGQAAQATPGCGRADVAPIVASAVTARVGEASAIVARVLSCDVLAGAEIESALAEPGARLGQPARFRLMGQGRHVGYAIAVAAGAVAHVRTSRAIGAGTPVAAGDLVVVRAEAPGVLVEALPARDSIVGARTVRALAAGEVVTSRVVRILPAVRSGDRVVIRATVGSVYITGAAMAQQTGAVGDVIRLVNPDSRRALRGRIVGKGEVEVFYGS